MPGSTPFFLDQTDGFEHQKVLRHSGTADGEAIRELADGGWPAPQQIEDCLAGRVRERFQQLASVGHTLTVSQDLPKVKGRVRIRASPSFGAR